MKTLIVSAALLSCPPVERPPTWFHHSPNRPVRVHFVQPERIDQACRSHGVQPLPGFIIIACAKGDDVWMPNPCRYDDGYGRLLCHEMAHVPNGGRPGWRH